MKGLTLNQREQTRLEIQQTRLEILNRVLQAGGGGYGDPLELDVDSILDDVHQEKLTAAYARRE